MARNGLNSAITNLSNHIVVDSHREEFKRELRDCREARPLTEIELRRLEDARWARHDAEVQEKYCGELVVPYRQRVVAHGTDAAAVLAEACRVTGRPAEELPLVGVIDPLLEMPH